MKNIENWKPSKYIFKSGRLMGSRDPDELAISSRLIADSVASIYQENIPKYVKGRMLDLGCGKVPLYIAYKDYIDSHVCVDWENSLHKNEFIDYDCDLTQELPFRDNEFDTVILSDVLEHIPEPDGLCDEISRVLAIHGKLLMNVPFMYWVHESPHDYNRYTNFRLIQLMENSGLKVLSITAVGGSPEIFADMLAKHLQAIPLVGSILAIFVQAVTGFLFGNSLGRKISNKTSKVYPLGYFLVATKQ